ncbi:MAG: SPOR domain-containing protein [Prevotellaceae bacterium]|jgi:hypothetical protein|nr:SPOR domain-containing protein [Prevotellaceae bacterium]
MKKIPLLLFAFLAATGVRAQDDIFQALQAGGHIVIRQNPRIEYAVTSHIARNRYRKHKGYRIRIFFDNGQAARQESAAIEQAFTESYPSTPVYREFDDLYYKVAVGDFRNRTDAMRFLENIKKNYPSAFIFSNSINFRRTLPPAEPADELKTKNGDAAGKEMDL